MLKQFLLTLSMLTLILAVNAVNAQERKQIPDQRTVGTIPSTEDLEEITRLMQKYKKAWSTHDAASLMALHSEDTEWMNAYGRIFQGRKSLKEFFEDRLFPGFPVSVSKREMDNLKVVSTRYIGSAVVVLHLFTNSERGESRNGSDASRRTHMHLVIAKSPGGWEVEHTAIFDVR